MKKKKILAMALAFSVAVFGCACGNKTNDADEITDIEVAETETSDESEAPTEIDVTRESEEPEETEVVISPADETPEIVQNQYFEDAAAAIDGLAYWPVNDIEFSDWTFTTWDGFEYTNASTTEELRNSVTCPVYSAGDVVEFHMALPPTSWGVLMYVSYDIDENGIIDFDNPTSYGLSDPAVGSAIDSGFASVTLAPDFLSADGSFTIPEDCSGKIFCLNWYDYGYYNYVNGPDFEESGLETLRSVPVSMSFPIIVQ